MLRYGANRSDAFLELPVYVYRGDVSLIWTQLKKTFGRELQKVYGQKINWVEFFGPSICTTHSLENDNLILLHMQIDIQRK